MKIIDEYLQRKHPDQHIVVGCIDSFSFVTCNEKIVAAITVSNQSKQTITCNSCSPENSYNLVVEVFVPDKASGLVVSDHFHVHPDENIVERLKLTFDNPKLVTVDDPESKLWLLFASKIGYDTANPREQMFQIARKGLVRHLQSFSYLFNQIVYHRKDLL